jgi:hypothetical protein
MTSVYQRMYALAVNRTRSPEKMRARACKKTSKASRLDEKKPESVALGRATATELTGDGLLVGRLREGRVDQIPIGNLG